MIKESIMTILFEMGYPLDECDEIMDRLNEVIRTKFVGAIDLDSPLGHKEKIEINYNDLCLISDILEIVCKPEKSYCPKIKQFVNLKKCTECRLNEGKYQYESISLHL